MTCLSCLYLKPNFLGKEAIMEAAPSAVFLQQQPAHMLERHKQRPWGLLALGSNPGLSFTGCVAFSKSSILPLHLLSFHLRLPSFHLRPPPLHLPSISPPLPPSISPPSPLYLPSRPLHVLFLLPGMLFTHFCWASFLQVSAYLCENGLLATYSHSVLWTFPLQHYRPSKNGYQIVICKIICVMCLFR